MRALLIANPKATSTSRRVRRLLVRAFTGDLDLEIAETEHRGHATELARRAVGKFDVVLALGGDGTVNEVVNGLLADGPSPALPALAVLPIGSANVFARALGLPGEPIRAARRVLDALRTGRHRDIGLGLADGRYFTFCAGMGLDAEVIRAVERRRHAGAKASPALYLTTTLRHFFSGTDRRHPAITVERPGHPPIEGVFLSFVSNTAPWTFLGPLPVNPSPLAHFASGLDVFGIRSLEVMPVLSAAAGMLRPGRRPVRTPDVVNVHDAAQVTLRAGRPMAFQLDGDYLGQRHEVTFRSVPRAIRVVG